MRWQTLPGELNVWLKALPKGHSTCLKLTWIRNDGTLGNRLNCRGRSRGYCTTGWQQRFPITGFLCCPCRPRRGFASSAAQCSRWTALEEPLMHWDAFWSREMSSCFSKRKCHAKVSGLHAAISSLDGLTAHLTSGWDDAKVLGAVKDQAGCSSTLWMQRLIEGQKLDGNLLSDAEDEPEGQNPYGNEQPVHQPAVAHSPARQSESDADKNVRQEEDDQKQVQIGVHVLSRLQRQKGSVVPGVA